MKRDLKKEVDLGDGEDLELLGGFHWVDRAWELKISINLFLRRYEVVIFMAIDIDEMNKMSIRKSVQKKHDKVKRREAKQVKKVKQDIQEVEVNIFIIFGV